MSEHPPSKDLSPFATGLQKIRNRVAGVIDGTWLLHSEASALLEEIERLSRPAHEREPPHCANCSCHMPVPEPSISAKVGAVLISGGYLDRMKDLTEEDTAEVVVQAFLNAVRPVLAQRSAPEPAGDQLAQELRAVYDKIWIREEQMDGHDGAVLAAVVRRLDSSSQPPRDE